MNFPNYDAWCEQMRNASAGRAPHGDRQPAGAANSRQLVIGLPLGNGGAQDAPDLLARASQHFSIALHVER